MAARDRNETAIGYVASRTHAAADRVVVNPAKSRQVAIDADVELIVLARV
jgi:hypothetical protein